MSDHETATQPGAYLPELLLERLSAGRPPSPGDTETLDATVVLHASLTGHESLPERLSHYGQEGVAALSEQLDAIFDTLIQRIHTYGGSILALRGDGLLAAFVQEDASKFGVSCALKLHTDLDALRPLAVLDERLDVALKVGLGYGALVQAYVGRKPTRKAGTQPGWSAVLFGGEAVIRAEAGLRHASRGDVILDPYVVQVLAGVPAGPVLEGGYVVVEDVVPLSPPPPREAPNPGTDRLRPYLTGPAWQQFREAEGSPAPGPVHATSLFVNLAEPDSPGADLHEQLTHALETISLHGGTLVSGIMRGAGTQLHAMFGAPFFQEHVEIRALRCARDIVQRDIDTGATAHAGLATGRLFAAICGGKAHRGYVAIGQAVESSEDLASRTAPDEILLDEATHHRALEAFTCESLRDVRLKHAQGPHMVYRLSAPRAALPLTEARYLRSKRPPSGREAESARARRVVERALSGEAQILLVTGAPGVGKSRLVEETMRLWLPSGQVLGGDCSPRPATIAYQPWAEIVGSALALPPGLPDSGLRAAFVERVAALCPTYPEAPRLLAPLLGIPLAGQPEAPARPASDSQQRLADAVGILLDGLARRRPLMLVISDLHWADDLSRRLAAHVAQHCARSPFLLCLDGGTPETGRDLRAAGQLTHLKLDPLPAHEEARHLIDLARNVPGPFAGQLEKTLGIADGSVNPLHVEQTAGLLLQAGALVPDGHTHRFAPNARVDLPQNAQDALQARLNALDQPLADLLATASVLGSPFALTTLSAAQPGDTSADELAERLEALVGLGVLVRHATHPAPLHSFQHSTMEELVYAGLPDETRSKLHARVGDALEQMRGPYASPALLEAHFSLGQRPDTAARYGLAAGEQAQAMGDYPNALERYQHALSNLTWLPDDDARPLVTRLRYLRGRIYLEQERFAELLSEIQEIRRLALYSDDAASLIRAGVLDGARHYAQGDFSGMTHVTRATADLAAEHGLEAELAEALRVVGFPLPLPGQSGALSDTA